MTRKANVKIVKIEGKKIIFLLPEQWHRKIKLQALEQNISMKQWVLDAIGDKFKKQKDLGWD